MLKKEHNRLELATIDILKEKGLRFDDNTESYTDADFNVYLENGVILKLEVKIKNKYNIDNWVGFFTKEQEPFKFILDDTAYRRCMVSGGNEMLLIQNVNYDFVVFSIFDLAYSIKKRGNRELENKDKEKPAWLKGKCIIDMRNGRHFKTLSGAIDYTCKFVQPSNIARILNINSCYERYNGESINLCGILRTQENRDKCLSGKV